jgi:hypothetical protein
VTIHFALLLTTFLEHDSDKVTTMCIISRSGVRGLRIIAIFVIAYTDASNHRSCHADVARADDLKATTAASADVIVGSIDRFYQALSQLETE